MLQVNHTFVVEEERLRGSSMRALLVIVLSR